jgi:2-amino-4-hydroxy-6-hydroxymethyldihydropteridine diphosphokinase/dihydropteroate synthase
MKAFGLGRRVGGRALFSRNVPALFHARVFQIRHQSSSKEPPKTAQWTQYSLDEFAPPLAERDALSEGSKKTPTVHTAYIALGSNLGDRIGWIESACKLMSSRQDIKIHRTSCLWETEPMYVMDQGSFVNGVCEVTRMFQSASQLCIMDPSNFLVPKPQSHD